MVRKLLASRRGWLGLRVSTLLLCSTPYLGLLVYLRFGMHATQQYMAVPSPLLFVLLGSFGIALPCTGLVIVLRTLVREREHFQLALLLESYAALVLVFASSFAMLQAASGTEPAFSGMSLVWETGREGTLAQHVTRLHEVFFDSLYLSTITISTVGYGDLVPLSWPARALSALEGLVGIAFFGIAFGHYFSVCVHRSQR